MPSPRSAGLIAVVLVVASLLPGPVHRTAAAAATPSATSSTVREPINLTELRREAEKAAKELEAATKALEQRRNKIRAAEKELERKLRELQAAEQELSRVRRPLTEMVEMLYQQSGSGDLAAFLAGQSGLGTLRALSDVSHIIEGRDQVVTDAARLFGAREKLATEAQNLRADGLLAEAQLAVEVDTLRRRSDKIVKSLTQALVKLGIRVDKVGRAALGCDPTKATLAGRFPNGLIPGSYLCPLQQTGEQLRGDAAIAFISLNELYKRRFGKPICVSDSYRSLGEQQAVYYRRPGLAAVPGRSNHGLGLAVDLCGGVERYRSVEFNWLEANGKKYGWIHPDWAKTGPFEPWHWEYDPEIGSLL